MTEVKSQVVVMTDHVHPTEAQIASFTENGPDGAIVMVNLLKYRARAVYAGDRAEAKEDLTGRQAYQRYGMVAFQTIAAVGGGIVWAGQPALVFIGDDRDAWDDVVCVRYPSRQAFLEMVARPDYNAASYHRDAGLERTALICCKAGTAA
jgi:uncharacterized protein (DUF1330 family)